MVHVTNRPDIAVRLRPRKLRLRHVPGFLSLEERSLLVRLVRRWSG